MTFWTACLFSPIISLENHMHGIVCSGYFLSSCLAQMRHAISSARCHCQIRYVSKFAAASRGSPCDAELLAFLSYMLYTLAVSQVLVDILFESDHMRSPLICHFGLETLENAAFSIVNSKPFEFFD